MRLYSPRLGRCVTGRDLSAWLRAEEDRLYARRARRCMFQLGRLAKKASKHFGCEIIALDVLMCS